MSIVIVKTKEDAMARTRQERRENERRIRDGLQPKPLTEYKLEETSKTKLKKKKAPPPKAKHTAPPAQQPISLTEVKGLSKKEQEVLKRTLIKSVDIIDEGTLVDSPSKIKDNTPADISCANLEERRKKARERREKLKH